MTRGVSPNHELQKARISAAMKGRVITWGDKITAATKGRPGKRLPIAERFWPKVARRGPDDCWEWQGAVDTTGYGVMSRPGGVGESRKVYAHRVSRELDAGPIPTGYDVMHRCDDRRCVNPRHLTVGIRLDNVRDMWSKGRAVTRHVTHCKHGHEFTPDNTYVAVTGRRQCRACARIRAAAHRASRAA